MATADSTQSNPLAPSQYSTTLLAGSLYRGPDGRWYWSRDGALAHEVRDMRLGALLPRFHSTNRYGRLFYSIAFTWRQIHHWQGDASVACLVDELLARQQQQPVGGERMEFMEGKRPMRRARALGALVAQRDFDEIADRVIPSWSAKDSVAVLAGAQQRSAPGFLDDEDLQRELDLVRLRFFSSEARARYGHQAMKACEAWGVVTDEMRSVWQASESRYNLWQCEWAMGRAWNALPPNFYLLSKSELWAFAQKFSPSALEDER